MARTIRRLGLRLLVGMLRMVTPPAASGWQHSTRPVNLRHR